MKYLQIHVAYGISITQRKLDKDRFRRDLGQVEDAYQEILNRLSEGFAHDSQ
jgi:phosphoribosylaminoimidazole-succinocarboxamide synthase